MTFGELPKPIPIGNKAHDFTGYEINSLTVLYRVPNDKNKEVLWACYCRECGEYCIKRVSNIMAKSASCDNKKYHINLVSQKFNKLIPIQRNENYYKNGHFKYLCLCECGNLKEANGSDLVNGNTKSCGCITTRKDISGCKYGLLTAIEPTEKRKGRNIVWKCACECGNIAYYCTQALTLGKALSCGCRKSSGEIFLQNIIKDNNISFKTNYSFNQCVFPDTNCNAKFDFYINDNNNAYLIEFDGEQHFKYTNKNWNTKENFVDLHNHDLFKNQWAWDNKIPMKRIPYTERQKLTLNHIISNEYLITPQTHPWWYPPKNSSYPYFTIDNIDNREEVS